MHKNPDKFIQISANLRNPDQTTEIKSKPQESRPNYRNHDQPLKNHDQYIETTTNL